MIQPHIDVYLSRATFSEVERTFPYLVAKEQASGGGDVPEFRWHIFEDYRPFEAAGVEVVPLPVHHGRYFCEVPASRPNTTTPSVPASAENLTPSFQPYICYAFSIDQRIVYMGDVSFIPDETWPHLLSTPRSVVVMDCLHPEFYVSHFGLGEAVQAARKLKPIRTYLTGLGHEIMYDEYVRVGEILGGCEVGQECLTDGEKECLGVIEEDEELWIRPAHDGLRVWVGDDDNVRDESHDT